MTGADSLSGVRLEVEADARVGILTLARPPVNALDAATFEGATKGLRILAETDEVDTVIITGDGTRSFSAGTDLGAFASQEEFGRVASASAAFFEALASSPIPLVGAINGPAVGGGAMIASECDVLIAVTGSYFSLPELSSHGLVGGGRHLRRLAPYFKAMRMMLLGERLQAEDAFADGVVAAVVSRNELRRHALDYAERLSTLEPSALRAARDIFRSPEGELASVGYGLEQHELGRLLAARDEGSRR